MTQIKKYYSLLSINKHKNIETPYMIVEVERHKKT